jgi:hypothetical protein
VAAQVLLDKWASRGCDPKVLAAIRKDVFNIDEPKKQRYGQSCANWAGSTTTRTASEGDSPGPTRLTSRLDLVRFA